MRYSAQRHFLKNSNAQRISTGHRFGEFRIIITKYVSEKMFDMLEASKKTRVALKAENQAARSDRCSEASSKWTLADRVMKMVGPSKQLHYFVLIASQLGCNSAFLHKP